MAESEQDAPSPETGASPGGGAAATQTRSRREAVQDASILSLIGRVINDVSDLADRQIELAKQEVREDIAEVIGAIKTLAIGAGIVAAAAILLVIWLWTAFIWFFNWLGSLILSPLGGGWLGSMLGWLLGVVIPAGGAYFAFQRFIRPTVGRVMGKVKNPLARTRTTLKEDLEWVRNLKTPSGR